MFARPEQNYEISEDVINGISADIAHPLRMICELLPQGATVLDIGAGSGVLGRLMKKLNKNIKLDGIEPNSFAANLAKPYYRNISVGYAQDYFEKIKANTYDYVILADVIEHTVDPKLFLMEVLESLSLPTKIIVSIPNVAFGGLRLSLLNGNFEYADSGLLERTHLRFFTLSSAKNLFLSLKLWPEKIFSLERSFYRVEFTRKTLKASLFQVMRLANDPNSRAYQYLFLLSRENKSPTSYKSYGANPIIILIDYIFNRPSLKKIYRLFKK